MRGYLLNVFGDFPTLADSRQADAYSPLWDAQLGLWTHKAIDQRLNVRQIDENIVFNLAATMPDLLTGINPATSQPAPYGSARPDINCAVIAFIAKARLITVHQTTRLRHHIAPLAHGRHNGSEQAAGGRLPSGTGVRHKFAPTPYRTATPGQRRLTYISA